MQKLSTTPTPYDRPIDEALAAILRMAGEAPEGVTALQAQQRKQEAQLRLQQLTAMREQFAAAQAELTTRIGETEYERWRKHGWFMPPQLHPVAAPLVARGEPVLVVQHRELTGQITVRATQVAYEGSAAQDAKAIESGVLHAKEKWQNGMAVEGGDAEFRATAWAYAQIHGVKVVGYKPKWFSPEHKLARTIISREKEARKAAKQTRPSNPVEVGPDGLPILREVVSPARVPQPTPHPAAAPQAPAAQPRQPAFA